MYRCLLSAKIQAISQTANHEDLSYSRIHPCANSRRRCRLSGFRAKDPCFGEDARPSRWCWVSTLRIHDMICMIRWSLTALSRDLFLTRPPTLSLSLSLSSLPFPHSATACFTIQTHRPLDPEGICKFASVACLAQGALATLGPKLSNAQYGLPDELNDDLQQLHVSSIASAY